MNQHGSDRQQHLETWYQFLTAVETDDCVTVAHLRGKFSDQQLGEALVEAARFNSVNALAELLTNPSHGVLMYVHDALMISAENGHTDVLRVVMQHTNPKRRGCYNLAMWGALVHNHPQCVELLFNRANTDEVLRLAHEQNPKPNAAWDVFEQRIAARQKQHLEQKIDVKYNSDARGVRKM